MENINFQTQQRTNFLPVCQYILSFGMFLYNQSLISLNERNHSTCILNAFFKYIHNSENEYKMKVHLLEKVQKESHLYDNVKNIQLDVKYVDATYQHIISTALFSQYGNINGYLATIIRTASDVTYYAFKEKVLQHFSKKFVCSDYCSFRYEDYKLSPLTIEKVFKENIWSIFPEPDENMLITDVNYIYAMTGLRIFKSIQSDIVNLPFDNYILLSQAIEFQTFDNETLYFVLELFATPALLYFSYTEKGKILDEYTNSSILSSSTLWRQVYLYLFSHFNYYKQNILVKEFNNILFSRLYTEFFRLRSKSNFEKVYQKCQYSFTEYLTHFVNEIFDTSFQTINQNKCNELRLTEIDARYNAQFDPITEIVTQIVENSLEQIVLQSNILKTLLFNATVKLVQVLNINERCTYCVPTQKKENRGIYTMFAIIDNKKAVFYSIKQENYTLTLLEKGKKERKLAENLQDFFLKIKNSILFETLKYHNEDYKAFITRLTNIITYEFVQELKTQGNDLDDFRFTKVKANTLNSLVPFYTCIDTIEIDSEKKTSISCNIVVDNFHSINPPKNSSIMWNNFITILGQQILPNIPKSDTRKSKLINILTSALDKVARTLTVEISKEILQRNVSYVPMQIKEPAFELSFQVSAHSNQVLQRITRTLSTRFPSIPKFQDLLLSIESTMKIFNENEKLLQDKISQMSNATGKPIDSDSECLLSDEDY